MPRSNFVRARKMFRKIGNFSTISVRKFEPRHEVLRAIEGVYKVSDYYGDDQVLAGFVQDVFFKDLPIKKYLPNGRRLSQYLLQGSGVDSAGAQFSPTAKEWQARVAKFIEHIQEKEYHITCKGTDIARMSLSKHYSSCRNLKNGDYSNQCLEFMSDPCVALIVVKDRGGDFLGRQIIKYLPEQKRWNYRKQIYDTRSCIISIHKAYGNIAPRASLAAVALALSLNPKLQVTVEDKRSEDG